MPENKVKNQQPQEVKTETVQPVTKPTQPVVKKDPKKTIYLVLISLFVVLAGVGTGWLISGKSLGTSSSGSQVAPGAKSDVKEAGLADESTFRDSAEGVLEEGGVDGEGTHHLVREGGPSQNVYLTSTVIDLQSFVGKKVQIWGETITAKQAAWLMDVGKIKVAE